MNLALKDLQRVVDEERRLHLRGRPYRQWVLVNYPEERRRLWVPEKWIRSFFGGEPVAVAVAEAP